MHCRQTTACMHILNTIIFVPLELPVGLYKITCNDNYYDGQLLEYEWHPHMNLTHSKTSQNEC